MAHLAWEEVEHRQFADRVAFLAEVFCHWGNGDALREAAEATWAITERDFRGRKQLRGHNTQTQAPI